MEEGLPSYEEALMVGQERKQDMVSKVLEEEKHYYLPPYMVEEEVTEGLNEVFEESLEEMTCLGEVLEENLDEVVEVGAEMVALEAVPRESFSFLLLVLDLEPFQFHFHF